MNRLRPLVALWISMSLGCADGALIYERSVDYAHNPAAHPSAPEAPVAPPPLLLGDGPSPVAHADPPPGEVVYVCPMHADVVSDAPGKCPRCGMGLSPRPKAESAPAHQHQKPGGTP